MSNRTAMARIYLVHQEVKSGSYPNVPSLMEQLECSERTIRRDLELMRDRLGAPLCYDRSKRGYHYDAEYSLPAVSLSTEEMEAVWVAHQWLRQTKGTPYELAMQNVWTKLTLVFGLDERVQRALSVVRVADVPKAVRASDDNQRYQLLEEAAQTCMVVQVEYYSPASGEVTVREIEPLHLYLTLGACYCVAYCRLRQEFRTFAVSRIRSLRVTGDRFEKVGGFSLDRYLGGSVGVMRGERVPLRVRFSVEQARYVDEFPRHASQRRVCEDEKGVVYDFEVADNPETMRWLFSFGSAATILTPESLASRHRAGLHDALKNYEGDA